MGAYGSGFGIYKGGGAGSTTITGSGTPNFQARFITAQTIGDGVIQDDGTTTGVGTAPVANQTTTIKGNDTVANHSLVLTDANDATQFGFRNDGCLELTALGKIAYADGFGGNLTSDATSALRTWNFPDASGEILLDNLLGVANGIATLDAGGKVPNSQLPFNLMEFLGNWNATTNTPALANADVGAQGNTYNVSVAGTHDFGAGNITFDVGDWVVNNGTIWEKVDNTDAVLSVNGNAGVVTTPLADVLAQGTTTGANSISVNAGQNIIYNSGAFTNTFGTTALTASRIIVLPDASGTVALTSQITGNGIFDAANDGTSIPAAFDAVLTDTFTLSGGSTIITTTGGGNTLHTVVGTSALTFGIFGDLNTINTGGVFDGFTGVYDAGTEPTWQAQIYDNTTFVEQSCVFAGVADFSGTDRPYFAGYYTIDGVAYTGFQADITGEQLYTQRLGVVVTALTAADRVLFTTPTGYIRATTYADLASLLNVSAVTDDVIPRGDGTSIEDGTWQNVGNDIYPTTTGANIGQAANRIGTIFMSSTVDHTTDLNFISGGNTYNTFNSTGAVKLARTGAEIIMGDAAVFPITMGTAIVKSAIISGGGTWNGFHAQSNGTLANDVNIALVANKFGNSAIRLSHDLTFEDDWNGNMGTSSTARMKFFVDTHNFSIGTVSNSGRLRVAGSDASVGVISFFASGTTTSGGFQVQNDNRVGVGAMGTTSTKINVRGIGATSATTTLNIQNSATTSLFSITDDGSLTSTGYNTTITSSSPVWNISANITERSGGDGYSVYRFDSTFAGASSNNHYRTMYVHAPTGGVNPSIGRYAIYGDAFFSSGSGNDKGIGVFGRAGNSTTRNYGVYGNLTQGMGTTDNVGVYSIVGVNALGSLTASAKAFYGLNIQQQATVTGEMVGGHFWAIRTAAAAGVGRNIGIRAAATGAGTNIAIQVLSAQGVIVLGTTNPSASTFLTVRGTGATSATNAFVIENSSGVDHLVVRDNGQVASYTGGGASFIANVANYYQASGFTTSFAWYSRGSSTTRTASFQHTSGGNNTVIVSAAYQGGATGTAIAIQGNGSPTTGHSIAIGVQGLSRNGSASSIGVQGNVGGGATVLSGYVAGVEGNTTYNLDSLKYGGRFIGSSGNLAGLEAQDKIGVFGLGTNNTVASLSTSIAIGGQFRTSTSGGGGGGRGNMALNVPATSNDGISVFGADNASVNNSTVEVTGNIEVIGGANGLILEDRTTGTRYRVYMDNGSIFQEAA